MGIDFRGLVFLGFTGFGATLGAVFSLPFLAAGFVAPAAAGWAWVPFVGCTAIFAVWGVVAEMRG